MPTLTITFDELAASLSQNVDLPSYIRSITADGDSLVVDVGAGPLRTSPRISVKGYVNGLLLMHVEMNSTLQKILSFKGNPSYDGVSVNLPYVHVSVNEVLAKYVNGMEVTDVTSRDGKIRVTAVVCSA